MSKFVTRFLNDESGATAIEYGLIIALMATVVVTVFTALGGKLGDAFGVVGGKLDAAGS